jgi:abortive infection bacteriophage resistance protein
VGAFVSGPTTTGTAPPLKPFITASEQIELLRSRGLEIHDEQSARAELRRLGYYRFSGFAHALKAPRPDAGTSPRQYKAGATFPLVIQLAEFDKALRLLVLQGLESIEIAVRSAVVERLGRYDVEAHRNRALLDGRFTVAPPGQVSAHDEWLQRFDLLVARSKEDLVEHHRQRYGDRMPLWAVLEILEFGLLSRLVAGLRHRDRSALAQAFEVGHPGVLTSWLHTFNVTRNRAAHHARLWNRTNTKAPLLPAPSDSGDLAFLHLDEFARKRLFGTLCCMRLMIRAIAPRSDWHLQLKALTAAFPASSTVSLHSAGFPEKWEELSLWKA